jgi:KDO2-lipid IV(A) lauroyltransferase
MDDPRDVSFRPFWGPRYWITWLLWLLLNLTWRLPLGVQLTLGRLLGRALGAMMRRDRRYAQRNLEICFPELEREERTALVRRHFEAIGMSFLELGIGWFTPIDRLEKLVRVEGYEHLEAATRDGRGVLLFAAHFTTLEVGVAILESLCARCSCMYRPQRNAMMDRMMLRGRSRFAERQIPRDDVRALIKDLKRGFAVVYIPDQTYLGNQSEILPFFGEPAVTNIATSKIARIAGVDILPYYFRRLSDDSGYSVSIGPPVPGVPSTDAVEDSRKLFARLEAYIRLAPEQYLWVYRKFKRRPENLGNPYIE